jgi:putative nucleotidyltransferase with HDIG domain
MHGVKLVVVEHLGSKPGASTTDTELSGVFEVLAEIGERVADEPAGLQRHLEDMARGLRENLGFRALSISVGARSGDLFAADGEPSGRPAVEVPVRRGKMLLGEILAFPGGPGRSSEARIVSALRMAAAVASLAVSAADASVVAAERAAQGNVVQLASEVLGRTLDEGRLYRTVLVLALELLRSSAGVVFLDGGEVAASVGFEGHEERLRLIGEVNLSGGQPWLGRVGGGHALGVRVGRSGGSVFLFREAEPYTVAEGVSFKLVGRQLGHAQERSRLHEALERTGMETIMALAATLESRDGTTGEHIGRVELLAERVAVGLGLDPDDVQAVRYAAILHDIGKIGVPDDILSKPGKLTEPEWEVMKRHPAIGAGILAKITGFERVSEAVLTHHERFDGRGYPSNLAGADIPVESRIVSVVDAYDAMTSDRPYRRAVGHEEAMKRLDSGAGTQFDPEVVEAAKVALAEERRAGRKKEDPR